MTSTEISISLSDILIAILTLVVAGLGFVIKEQLEKIKTIQNQLSDKKYKLYHEIYSLFFDVFKQEKGLQKKNNNDLVIRLIDIKKDLFIYAPDNIVKKFSEWNRYLNNHSGDIKHIAVFLELFILIRMDMGNHKTEITNLDILRSIMTTDEEFDNIKKLLK
jgi:hypothetical protein